MTLEKLELKLHTDGDLSTTEDKRYQIYPIQTVDIESRKEAFSIAPPGLAASENILLGISGMQADISIDFTIWDDGTDRADGSHTSSVISVPDQIGYLEDTMQDPGFQAAWELDHTTGSAFDDDEVFVENVAPTVISQESPKWKPCRMRLRRGGSV